MNEENYELFFVFLRDTISMFTGLSDLYFCKFDILSKKDRNRVFI